MNWNNRRSPRSDMTNTSFWFVMLERMQMMWSPFTFNICSEELQLSTCLLFIILVIIVTIIVVCQHLWHFSNVVQH